MKLSMRSPHLRCGTALAALIAIAPFAMANTPGNEQAREPSEFQEARIAFAANKGIQTWRAVDRETLLIEARGRKWYRAELMSVCPGLQHASTIGFDYQPDGSFDRFSSIIVDGLRCPLKSLKETESPRAKKDADTAAN